ncbi:MAG: hypothetical protein ACRCRZ_01675 [Metamycoplasmataceae bacterium]
MELNFLCLIPKFEKYNLYNFKTKHKGKNMTKKLLIGLGSVALVATPLVAVISCSSGEAQVAYVNQTALNEAAIKVADAQGLEALTKTQKFALLNSKEIMVQAKAAETKTSAVVTEDDLETITFAKGDKNLDLVITLKTVATKEFTKPTDSAKKGEFIIKATVASYIKESGLTLNKTKLEEEAAKVANAAALEDLTLETKKLFLTGDKNATDKIDTVTIAANTDAKKVDITVQFKDTYKELELTSTELTFQTSL